MYNMLLPLRNFLFKQAYFMGLHRLLMHLNRTKDNIYVLCLHRICDDKDPLFTPLSINNFKTLIRLLKKHFTPISFRDILCFPLKKHKKPFVILTFDDGYKDFVENALPILLSENVPANLNIVVDCAENGSLIWTQRLNNLICHLYNISKINTLKFYIDEVIIQVSHSKNIFLIKKKIFEALSKLNYNEILFHLNELELKYGFVQPSSKMMTWNEISECAKYGIEIGSHSYYHSPLNAESSILEKEIFYSKSAIENNLGQETVIFSFPNGIACQEAYNMAVDAGYKILLFIEDNNASNFFSQPINVTNYYRKLIYHPSPHESFFFVLGFHSFLKFN